MIVFKHKGNFNKTDKFLNNKRDNIISLLNKYGQEGVRALAEATPSDSGKTADSWNYTIKSSKGSYSVIWSNTHRVDGVLIAIILEYGHATGNGGYVQGREYINPAIQPIVDKISDELWKEVIK